MKSTAYTNAFAKEKSNKYRGGAQAPPHKERNQAMIQTYITYIRDIKGYSEHTCRAYEMDLRRFARWAKANTAGKWSAITRNDIDRYITTRAERCASTTNRELSAISSLYNYFRREGLLNENPCKYESRRKAGHHQPNTIPIADLKAAYMNAKGDIKQMIGLLAVTGIRIGELLNIEFNDINFDDGSIRIKGKGNKERTVYAYIEDLKDIRRAAQMGNGKVFRYDDRQARFLIWQAIRTHTNARQCSPHAIRHTMATQWAKEGENATTIAQALGHRDIRTSQKYIDMAAMRVKAAAAAHTII